MKMLVTPTSVSNQSPTLSPFKQQSQNVNLTGVGSATQIQIYPLELKPPGPFGITPCSMAVEDYTKVA
jgi:hypothetical protein